jgi:hypothetical protein
MECDETRPAPCLLNQAGYVNVLLKRFIFRVAVTVGRCQLLQTCSERKKNGKTFSEI